MINFFNTFIFEPLYNLFILLMDALPLLDAGIIIVIFTIVVKILMLPLSVKTTKSQIEMRDSQKDINEIKEKYKDDKQEQSRKILEYYKEKGINPFAGIFLLIIQLPILIGLYQIFIKSGLPEINTTILYSFIPQPETINMVFIGLFDISQKSVFLALLVGLTSYYQIKIVTPPQDASSTNTGMQAELAKAMSMQMKYVFPIMMAFISYTISSAVAIYFIASNIFTVIQEIYLKSKLTKTVL